MRFGVLTGGGDAPGLNHALRALVIRSAQLGHEVLGFRDGWKGVLEGSAAILRAADFEGLHDRGGTMLGTSRTNVFKVEGGPDRVRAQLAKHRVDVLIGIGGEDTLGVLNRLSQLGVPCVGVPKTIDNDLDATDFTIGFDTAIGRAMEAIDNLATTADSHHRCLIVEIMGRHAGWMTWYAGIAGCANVILVPEEPIDLDAVCRVVKDRAGADGRGFSIVAVSEGAALREEDGLVLKDEGRDPFGHVKLGGIGEQLAKLIEKRTGVETRSVLLGHLQRGGPPSAMDRVLATQFGWRAAELAHARRFGRMPAARGGAIVDVALADAVGKLKTVDADRLALSRGLWG
jgi:6-phosphofructokinase 1